MLYQVKVKKTGNPDEGYTDKDDLFMDVLYHRDDVKDVMYMIASHLEDVGDYHDHTKLEYFDDFAKDTLERLETPDFKQRNWYNIHTTNERHHINANVPEKVNFFDLLEMQVDCIIAGLTRSGYVNRKFLEIPDDVLKEAYWNTIDLITEYVVVDDE